MGVGRASPRRQPHVTRADRSRPASACEDPGPAAAMTRFDRLLFRTFAWTDSIHVRSFWNGFDYFAAFMTGALYGTGWEYHFASYMAGRVCGLWLVRQRDRKERELLAMLKQMQAINER